ncbi:bifunctional UDP-4-keto-pentose/UDP-xylose synthase, partial [Cupriavidus sp. CP313]
YNIGNPGNIHSVRELAEMMLKMAADYPEYADEARKTQIIETSSGDFYGKGYQDVQHRVPKIDNTIEELGWKPEISMEAALRRIFEAYRGKVVEARTLVDSAN